MDRIKALVSFNSREGKKFDVLDSWRGIAALGVAYIHSGLGSFKGGYLAVDFFFLLSGFILAYSYHGKSQLTRSPGQFVINRIARLYPLHIFTFILFALVIFWERGEFPKYGNDELFSIFQQLTLTHNIGLSPIGGTWNFPSWSISVELWVGIIFIAFIRPTTSSFKLLFTSLAIMVFLSSHVDNLDLSFQNFYVFINAGILRCLGLFLVGILAYRSWQVVRNLELSFVAWSVIEVIAVSLSCLLLFMRDEYHSEVDFFAPVIFYVVVLVFAMEKGILSMLLFNLRYLGKISYSIYLNHLSIMIILRYLTSKYNPWTGDFNAFYYFVVLIGFSALTYHFIEIPGKRLLQNALKKGAALKNRKLPTEEPRQNFANNSIYQEEPVKA